MQRQKTLFWSGISLILVGILLILSSDTLSLSAQEPSPTEPTTPPPLATEPPPPTEPATATLPSTATELPPATEPATATRTDTATVTASATPTDTATQLPTTTDTPSGTPSLTATTPPSAPTIPVPEGPVVLLSETAESDTSWWRFDGTWARSNLGDAHSGDWCFAAHPGSLYPASLVAALSLAQPLSLPPGTRVELQYWQRLDLAGGDSAQVQVSTDNANWATVVGETAVRNLAWTVRTVRLDAYAGQSLWLRFVLASDADPMTVGEGWWLDDITVWAEPLPVMPRSGLTAEDSDNPTLWLTEGNWQAVGAPIHSGSLAWTTTSHPNTATGLTLNADVSLAGMNTPELRFWQKLNLTSGGESAQVELSLDGGQTWRPVRTYSAAENTADWNEQVIGLDATGQTVRVRFLLIAGPDGLQATNWAVDTITLQSGTDQPPTTSPAIEASMPVTSTPIVTPTPQIIQTPGGDADWVTYQDTDQLLVYGDGIWTTFAVVGASGGTLTATADKGATLNVAFAGTAVEVIYSKGPEGGSFSGQIWGELIDYRNSNWDSYTYGHTFLFEDLMSGPHFLTITNGDGALWIEAVRVRGVLLQYSAFEAAPSSIDRQTGYHFYLGQDSQELTILSSHTPDWFYDSVEWVNLPAASNPVVGVCYTVTLQGEDGIQFAEMGSYLDGYGDPWKSFWWDSSGPGPGTYPTCVTDGYL